MIEFISNNQHAGWFTLGFVLLAIELLVLSLATGFLLFIGLAALLTGSFVWLDIIPQTWIAGVACFGVSSVALSALMYKPLKNLQSDTGVIEKDTSSDMIGMEFRLEQDISYTSKGKIKYSGIEWQVEIDKSANVDSIAVGSLVAVVSVDVALFRVKSV